MRTEHVVRTITTYTAEELREYHPPGFRVAYAKYLRKLDRQTEDDGKDRSSMKSEENFIKEATAKAWRYTRGGNYI